MTEGTEQAIGHCVRCVVDSDCGAGYGYAYNTHAYASPYNYGGYRAYSGLGSDSPIQDFPVSAENERSASEKLRTFG